MEVMSFVSLFRVSLSLARGRTRILPENAVLDQSNRRPSARSVFFRVLTSLAMEIIWLHFNSHRSLRSRGLGLSYLNALFSQEGICCS